MMQVTVVDHPLIKQKITKMRAEHTSSRDFRECLDEIAMLMTCLLYTSPSPRDTR